MRRATAHGNPGRRVKARRRLILAGWIAIASVMVARAAEVQVVERVAWASEALAQHEEVREVPAARGRVLDRNGVELAVTHWRASVGVSPREIRDRGAVTSALVEELGLKRSAADSAVAGDGAWSTIPGRYSMAQVKRLAELHGVHVQGELRRVYPRSGLARGLLGAVRDGAGRGGVEQSMDSVLAGRPGREVIVRDSNGRAIPGRALVVEAPTPGRDVTLTIDRDLQAIAEDMLADAIARAGARGGDLVITDPRSGEILALTSVVGGSRSSLSAVNTTFEPGSTIKPFTTAALLHHGVAELGDSVDTEGGRWTVHGRTITDVERHGWLTLHDVIKRSSNIGIAKFAARLSRGQHYTSLRDFGFGTITGVPLPSEASGVLRRPSEWNLLSAHSLSYGYELSVTPLQMAMAFGALANGGALMKPLIVKELRDPLTGDAQVMRPTRIRQAIPADVASALTPVLVDAVEGGTGTQARMSTFSVAGKTGTTRATGRQGRYEDGAYHASFGAIFPADAPQLLFFVRLDRPRDAYHGGQAAAPVTLAAVESLLSARQAPIDRQALALSARRSSLPSGESPVVHFAATAEGAEVEPWDEGYRAMAGASAFEVRVPPLEGASARVALRRLHKLGLRVRLDGVGGVAATVPGPGQSVAPGDTVRVFAGTSLVPPPVLGGESGQGG